jgi:hypothetical protein
MLHENIPMYLKKVTFASEKKDGESRKICRLMLVIAPFDAQMAEELGSGIREHLFKRSTGEALEDIAEAKFAVAIGSLQELQIKLAPDQPGNVIIVSNVRVDQKVRVRRDKETPAFEAKFTMDFPYPHAEILQFLANQQNEQIIVSLQDEQLNMLDEQRREKKPRLARGRTTQPALDGGEPAEPQALTSA